MENTGSQTMRITTSEHKNDLGNAARRGSAGNWFWAGILLVLVILAANNRVLRHKVAPQWDATNFFGPAFSLVADHARAHRLLLWNPWISGGSPDFAEPELGATSPIMLLTGILFPTPWGGFIAYWMLIWIGAVVGMLLFARHLQSPPWGAAIAALGFAASGFFVAHAEHTSSLFSVAFLPWICWRFDDFLLTNRYWSAVEAGVLYGLSALGGYPEFTIVTPGFLVFWAAGRLAFCGTSAHWRQSKIWKSRYRVLQACLGLLLIGVVGAMIFCPSYLGFLSETHGYSDRVGPRSRAESLGSNILPAGALTTFSSPYLFLLNFPGVPAQAWPESDISMSNIYAGAIVTVLGFMALLNGFRWRYWLLCVAVLFLACALGRQLPVRGWLYDFVPPTRYFRNASQFSIYSIFIVCALAALAASDLEEKSRSDGTHARKFLVAALITASAALLTFLSVVHRVSAHTFPNLYRLGRGHLVILWGGIVVIAWLLYLRRIGTREASQILLALAVLDASVAVLVSAPVMYSPDTVGIWRAANHGHIRSLNLMEHGSRRQLTPPIELSFGVPSNQNVPLKLAVLASYQPLRNSFEWSLQEDPVLRNFALGEDRAWFSKDAVQVPPTKEAFDRFVSAAHKTRSSVLLVHSAQQMKEVSSSAANLPGASRDDQEPAQGFEHIKPASLANVKLLSYWPNSLKLNYEAPTDGWLMITDRWAAGWTAEVNGVPQTVYGADFVFRAVRVSAGSNTVFFQYNPRGWKTYMVLSWGTLVVFSLAQISRLIWKRR